MLQTELTQRKVYQAVIAVISYVTGPAETLSSTVSFPKTRAVETRDENLGSVSLVIPSRMAVLKYRVVAERPPQLPEYSNPYITNRPNRYILTAGYITTIQYK